MRIAGLAALGLILVALDYWWLVPTPPQPAPEPVHNRALEAAPASEPLQALHHERVAETAGVPPPEESSAEVTARPMDQDQAGRVVEGRFIVSDDQQIEHTEEDGEFRITYWRGDTGEEGPSAQVQRGRFRLPVDQVTEVAFDSVRLGGRLAFVDQDRLPVDPDTTALTVRARWARPVVLDVLYARTRTPVVGVQVVRGSDPRTDDCPYPGTVDPVDVLVRDAVSPVSLEAREGDASVRRRSPVWVGARGYAWSQVEVDFSAGGRRVVELDGAAVLEVALDGSIPAGKRSRRRGAEELDRPVLRLREGSTLLFEFDVETAVQEALREVALMPDHQFPDGQRPTEQEIRDSLLDFAQQLRGSRAPLQLEAVPAATGPTVLEGIRPGTYVIALERGDHWAAPLVLGESPVTLVAGQRTCARILVQPPPVTVAVPLAGTLYLPPAWGLHHLDLEFKPIGMVGKTPEHEVEIDLSDMQRVPETPGLFRWDLGEVAPGRYRVESYTLNLQAVVDTGPAGNTRAEVVVAEPADALVHVVDESLGRLVRVEDVSWGWESSGSFDSAEWDPAMQGFRFRAPAGQVAIRVEDLSLELVGPWDLSLAPGFQEVTLRVHKACGLVLCLMEDTVEVPWSEREASAVVLAGPDGKPAGRFRGSIALHGWGWAVPPGRYEVTVPPIPGYEPVPPFAVEVPAGAFLEHRVRLQTRR